MIVDQLGVNESEVIPEAKFIDDLGADSLDIVELIMALAFFSFMINVKRSAVVIL